MAGDGPDAPKLLTEAKAPDIDWGVHDASTSVRYVMAGDTNGAMLEAAGKPGSLGRFLGACQVQIQQGDLKYEDLGKKAVVSQFGQPADWHPAHVSAINFEKSRAFLTIDDCTPKPEK
jgi:hypothetical protein